MKISTTAAATEIRRIPLAALMLSKTGPQVARREHFTKPELGELVASIKTHGVLQPIVVRGLEFDTAAGQFSKFEIVAGERRFMGAKAAGLAEIPALVGSWNDEQVLEVQLIENLQRKDLHPLQEAEGYEQLMKLHGHQAEELGDKVGKSKAYVYGRLKLLALGKEARTAFYAGELSASIALLLARNPDVKRQAEALQKILKGRWPGDGPMSYRAAVEYLHSEFTFRLDEAGFPTGDVGLIPDVGSCNACPKRSGNQPELFGDIKRADVCTDPVCFRKKREAHAERALAAAEASGQKVIVGKDAAKVLKHGRPTAGYHRLDDRCYDDEKNRTFRQLLGKDGKPELLKDPTSGEVVELVHERTVSDKIVRGRGTVSSDTYQAQQRTRDKKVKRENAFRLQLYRAVLEKVPAKLARADLETVAIAFFNDIWHDARVRIIKAWWPDLEKKPKSDEDFVAAEVPKMAEAELSRFLLGLTFARELGAGPYSDSKPEQLLAAAKRLKVNADAIRKDLLAAEKAKAKKAPAKASKKKAAKK